MRQRCQFSQKWQRCEIFKKNREIIASDAKTALTLIVDVFHVFAVCHSSVGVCQIERKIRIDAVSARRIPAIPPTAAKPEGISIIERTMIISPWMKSA